MRIRLDVVNAILVGVGTTLFIVNIKSNPAAAWAWLFVVFTNAFGIVKDRIFAKAFNKWKEENENK